MKKLLFTLALLISFSSFGQDFNEDLIGSVWKLQFKEWSSHNSFVASSIVDGFIKNINNLYCIKF